jgi:peptide chain release factor 1
VFRVSGRGADDAFEHEAGGHRWQRVPPTEKRGRVQTSTVTVAVLEEPSEYEVQIDPRDLDEKFVRGSGKGGQHRNVTDSCVVLTHKPSGIKVRVDGGRSQHINRETAMGLLRARLKAAGQAQVSGNRSARRKAQVGTGMRADKVRTVALQRDQVTNHLNGRSMPAKLYLRGQIGDLV